MTKEDAIKIFNTVLCLGKCDCSKDEIEECLKMAIEALKTQPCNDYISRQFMYDMGATCIAARNKDGDLVALGALDILPSATPQPKTGHWTHDGGYWKNRWICSECGYKLYAEQSKYCPECGTKMQEEKK